MIDPKKASTLSETAHSIGYAIGVLEGLLGTYKMTDPQLDCVDHAITGLRKIDLCEIAGIGDGKEGRGC